jgi:hypothetical protein
MQSFVCSAPNISAASRNCSDAESHGGPRREAEII